MNMEDIGDSRDADVQDAQAEPDTTDASFPGGLQALIPQWQRRRAPFKFRFEEELPPANFDLATLREVIVAPETSDLPKGHTDFSKRIHDMNTEFAGKNFLCLLNALLIMNLRKREYPAQAVPLFLRLWQEEDEVLLAQLNGRWLISSVITFATHGVTEADRRIGQSLNVFFSLMKLYESERAYSGRMADQPDVRLKKPVGQLPLDMPHFNLASGDLEADLLGPLWLEALQAPGAGRLAQHLLTRMNHDPCTLFRRFSQMRDKTAGSFEMT